MKTVKKIMILVSLAMFLAFATGCEKEGPMEKAGEKIDESVEKAGDNFEKGPMEKTGEKIDESVEKMKETAEETGEKFQK